MIANNIKNITRGEKSIENRTVGSIYMHKIYNYLEKNTFIKVVNNIFLVIVSSGFTYLLAYPEQGLNLFKNIFLFENMIIPKGIIVFYLVFKSNFKIVKYLNIGIPQCYKKLKSLTLKKSEEFLCGVSPDDLLKHLLQEKTFKRADIESKFGMPRNQYEALAKKLDSVGILYKGLNNCRTLNEDYADTQIMKAILYAEGSIEKIQIHHEQVSDNGFSRSPLAVAR